MADAVAELVRDRASRLGRDQSRIICPACAHTRKRPHQHQRTMSVTREEDRIVYHCHHCGVSGAVRLAEDRPYPRIVQMEPARIEVQTSDLLPEHIEWLKSRGISEETARKAGVFGTQRWFPDVGKKLPAVAFPYFNKSAIYAAKFRACEGKAFAAQGSAQHFWGQHLHDHLLNSNTPFDLVIVEGEMDALSFLEAGILALSVPHGASMKVVEGRVDPREDGKLACVWQAQKLIEQAHRVIIATDQDGPGQALAEELARRIGKARCWKLDWPEGCKDANDMLLKHGVEVVRVHLNSSYAWPVAGLYEANHYLEQVTDLYIRGNGKGESTGFNNVDELYTVLTGQLTIVTGVPSSGKSEFIDQVMVNIAEAKDWKFAVCSFENPPPQHIAKLIEKRSRMPFHEGESERLGQKELGEAMEWINSHFAFIDQSDGEHATIESILERATIAVRRIGARGLVIDPYNYIEGMNSGDISGTEAISQLLTKVRNWAVSHDAHVWFVAHPAKMQRIDGKIAVPKGYDISGSAHWFNKTDCGITVHRGEGLMVEIHSWKCRFKWVGKQGMTMLEYQPVTGRYRETQGVEDDEDWTF